MTPPWVGAFIVSNEAYQNLLTEVYASGEQPPTPLDGSDIRNGAIIGTRKVMPISAVKGVVDVQAQR